ncbi:sodium/mannose cotransporter SLC5A10-like [Liolophura sinensis]|uniref:sodium/mannose cotransporter SLC5A10-like n=1 Tax=Liolophura sinensis TaxID=3198878 RepID=UPI003158F11D
MVEGVRALAWLDVLVIVLYFVLVLAIGLSSFCANTGSLKGYFLAGRSMIWLPVGASIFSSNVGSQFFIGMAGTAAASGIAVIIFEWHAVFILMLLGWFFIPVYVSSEAYTMPEYLKKRFGRKKLRFYLSVLAIFLLIIQTISVSVYAGAVFIQQATGWDMYVSIACVTVITAIYTIIGGLAAVIYTDTLQTLIMLGGSFVLMYFVCPGMREIGGINAIFEKYMKAVPRVTTCRNNLTAIFPRGDELHIFRDPIESDFPWPGTTIGLTPMAILAWCTDQVIVQRALAAKTLNHAKGGVILAGYLKILPFFIIVLPGMMSRILFPDTVGCVNPDICMKVCQDPNGCSNIAYPKLVLELLPQGGRGLMLAVMLSALMSTLTSVFNSASSIFTIDIYSKIKKSCSERELMIVGRLFILVLVAVSIGWIPILNAAQGGKLWDYLQSMQAYLAPPICVVFVLGVGWTRTTEPGAFFGMLSGHGLGVTRMILDLVYQKPACGSPDFRPPILSRIHYLYFSIILTAVTAIVVVVISLLTPKRPEAKLRRVTWWTKYSRERQEPDSDDEEVQQQPPPGDGIEPGDMASSTMQIAEGVESGRCSRVQLKRRLYNIVCCYSTFTPAKQDLTLMKEAEQVKFRGDTEKPLHTWLLNINAVVLMTVAVFLLAFYG